MKNDSNNKNHLDQPGDDTKVVGKKFDGAMQLTVSLALGVVFILLGAIISFYFRSKTSGGLFFGVPLIVTGFAIPPLLYFGWRK